MYGCSYGNYKPWIQHRALCFPITWNVNPAFPRAENIAAVMGRLVTSIGTLIVICSKGRAVEHNEVGSAFTHGT